MNVSSSRFARWSCVEWGMEACGRHVGLKSPLGALRSQNYFGGSFFLKRVKRCKLLMSAIYGHISIKIGHIIGWYIKSNISNSIKCKIIKNMQRYAGLKSALDALPRKLDSCCNFRPLCFRHETSYKQSNDGGITDRSVVQQLYIFHTLQ